jgi:hypothetical protein
LNVHYGLHAVAISGRGAFFTVYLLKAGLSMPGVLVSLALILLGRFIVRPVVIGLSVRWVCGAWSWSARRNWSSV